MGQSRDLLLYKGSYHTISEVARLSGKTYGAISGAHYRNPKLTGDQIVALKRRKEETYKGVTKSIIAWAESLDVSVSSLRIKSYAVGIERAIEFFGSDEYKNLKRSKHKKRASKSDMDSTDIRGFEFDGDLHAQRLFDAGLNVDQVFSRMETAGFLN